jgi:preprotein translocase subunit SecE
MMRQRKTIVGLFFLGAALLVAWVLHLAFTSLFVMLEVANRPIAGDQVTLSVLIGVLLSAGIALGTYLHPTTQTRVNQVADELNKVHWPTWAETKVNTLVVIVTSVIAAAVLGVFDITFLNLSDWLAELTF